MRIGEVFARKKAFVGYLTAGDPSASVSQKLISTLCHAGADIIELGVPHTDPIADGVTNAKAADRALKTGGGLRGTLEIAANLRREGLKTPFVLFTYLNPLLRMGLGAFADAAGTSGIDGVLVVDLPPEEAKEYCQILHQKSLDTIFLASPTTSEKRMKLVDELSRGFLYYVSRAGVTGAKNSLPAELGADVARVRQLTRHPIAVGFGISTPAQVAQVAGMADGVVVGSALVRSVETSRSEGEAVETMKRLAGELIGAMPGKGV